MARSMMPNSAGSQFFIMHKDAPHLDGAYTVFGEVTEGMDVVDRIQHVEHDANNRPLEDVRIIKATILRDLPGMEKKPKAVTRKVTKRVVRTRR